MNKTFVGVSLLAIVAISFGLFWSGTDDPAPSLRVTTPLPASAQARRVAEPTVIAESRPINVQARYDELLRERDQLANTNLALDDARLKLEKEKARVEHTAELMTAIATKLGEDGELQVPQTDAEAAVFAGQLHRAATDFNTRWGGAAPPAGTPESAAYQKELDALAADFAAFVKAGNNMESIGNTPTSLAQFQGLQLYSALRLSETQWQQLDRTLHRYLTEGFGRQLNGAARPTTGADVWEQQRTALSQRAFTEIRGMLTPAQRADFDRLYSSSFLWNFNIGGK